MPEPPQGDGPVDRVFLQPTEVLHVVEDHADSHRFRSVLPHPVRYGLRQSYRVNSHGTGCPSGRTVRFHPSTTRASSRPRLDLAG